MQNISPAFASLVRNSKVYSKFVPQDFKAYALYIIQCRPRKKKWCSHIYKFSSQTAAVKWLESVYFSFFPTILLNSAAEDILNTLLVFLFFVTNNSF